MSEITRILLVFILCSITMSICKTVNVKNVTNFTKNYDATKTCSKNRKCPQETGHTKHRIPTNTQTVPKQVQNHMAQYKPINFQNPKIT